MSKIFLITYDLKEPGQDYSELYEAIKGLAQNVYNSLRPQIDENDLLFIVDITDRNCQGWLSKTVWTWLN